jgi:hypothetical protein
MTALRRVRTARRVIPAKRIEAKTRDDNRGIVRDLPAALK